MKVIDYNHVFLYAKHHYKKSDDVLKDLQTILSHVYDLEPKDVEREEVYRVLITIGMEQETKVNFVNDLLEAFGLRHCFLNCKDDENDRLRKLLHPLFTTKYIVNGEQFNNFGVADPNILPLSEERKRKLKEGKDIK